MWGRQEYIEELQKRHEERKYQLETQLQIIRKQRAEEQVPRALSSLRSALPHGPSCSLDARCSLAARLARLLRFEE